MFFDDFFGCLMFVESGVVHDDQAVWRQFGDQHFLEPIVENVCVARGVKQHRRQEFCAGFSDLREEKIGSFDTPTRARIVDFYASACIGILALKLFFKAAFIKVDRGKPSAFEAGPET